MGWIERIELATRGLDCPTSIPSSANQAGFLALAARHVSDWHVSRGELTV
jgi:hypothetical protein